MKDTEILETANDQQEELFETYVLECTAGITPLRIDKHITNHIANISRNRVQEAIKMGWVLVNDKTIKANYKIRPHDKIVIHTPNLPDQAEVVPQEIPLDIRFEDDYLLIVHKPAGMVVHPGLGNYDNTLLNGIAYYLYQKLSDEVLTLSRFGLVHRIDKETSGLLVVAKTPEAAAHLGKQFFDHTTKREYIGLVWGDIEKETGTIVGNIGRHPQHRKKFHCFTEDTMGKHAVTHYKVIERFGFTTLASFHLETGRTHQIRVHMEHIGHPIFMDKSYGGDSIKKGIVFSKYKQFVDNAFLICPRHALHAKSLGFIHPITQQPIYLSSELPQDMKDLVEKWRQYSNLKKVSTS